ncbi:MAG: peptidase [Peptococcaceae bacterium]|nr:peptidase [Peptococcaceae bacterium]
MSTNTTDNLKCQQSRKKLLKKIEELRGSKVMVYVSHAPLDDSVLMPMYQELSHIGCIDRLDLFLNSYGGNIDTPYKLVKMLRGFCRDLTVIVPVAAKSAASMIVLGADQIIMGPFAELGPIDPVVRHPLYPDTWISVQAAQYSYDFFERLIDRCSPDQVMQILSLFEKIDPWILGDYTKMLKSSHQYAESLLKDYMFKENPHLVGPLVDKMINSYFSHGYPITKTEAQEMGLNILDISQELTDIIVELFLEYDKLLNFSS